MTTRFKELTEIFKHKEILSHGVGNRVSSHVSIIVMKTELSKNKKLAKYVDAMPRRIISKHLRIMILQFFD